MAETSKQSAKVEMRALTRFEQAAVTVTEKFKEMLGGK